MPIKLVHDVITVAKDPEGTFWCSAWPYTGTLFVFVGGLLQRPAIDYTLNGRQVSLSASVHETTVQLAYVFSEPPE